MSDGVVLVELEVTRLTLRGRGMFALGSEDALPGKWLHLVTCFVCVYSPLMLQVAGISSTTRLDLVSTQGGLCSVQALQQFPLPSQHVVGSNNRLLRSP